MAIKITEKKIQIKDLFKNYYNGKEEGGVWMEVNSKTIKGKVNIRPAYQREYVYKEEKRDAVIDSVFNGYPLNIMYWSKADNDEDFDYEVLDGQQRTISIGDYLNNDFSVEYNGTRNYYSGCEDTGLANKILDYELTIYICEGTEAEKMKWFEVINTAGVALNIQEIRNAIYSSQFVTNLRKYFSKTNGAGDNLRKGIITGDEKRQEVLKKVFDGYRDFHKESYKTVEEIMAKGRTTDFSEDIKTYFNNVIQWVKYVFNEKEMHKAWLAVDTGWFDLYNNYYDKTLNPAEIQKQVKKLLADNEIKSQKGIYYYVLDGNESHLNLRAFEKSDITAKWKQQGECCAKCNKHIDEDECRGDHVQPWSLGGKTKIENLQVLCQDCNARKSNKY